MKFNVGQIVYILSKKEAKVFPALVVEEICRKTVEEEITSHILRLPNKEKSEVNIDDIDAEIFTSLKKTESKMKQSADEQIADILSTAQKMEAIFNDDTKNIKKVDDDQVKIDLGNGMTANLDPESLEG